MIRQVNSDAGLWEKTQFPENDLPANRPFRRTLIPGACLLTVLSMLLIVPEAQAKLYLDLTNPGMARVTVAVPDFSSPGQSQVSGRELADIVKRDLHLTGLFTVLEPNPAPANKPNGEPDFDAWAQAGVQALIMGSFQTSGDQITVEARLYEVALRKMETGKKFTADVNQRRRVVHKFSERVLEALTGIPGCFTSKIAFIGTSRNKEVFVMDIDGHDPHQITRTGSINLSPEWTPDGTNILFTSYMARNPDLWVTDLNGSAPRPISRRRGINASARCSPVGNSLALSMSFEGTPKIFVITPQGDIIKRLTNGRGNDISPTWSPDGSAIAYVSDQAGSPQVYVVPVEGGQPKRVTFDSTYNTDPDWSPRGDLLAFTARVNGRFQICTIKADGGDFRVLTNQGSSQDPAWSPDGRIIAFSSDRSGESLIYVMDAQGEIQLPVSRIPGKAPAWSPRF